MSSTGYFTSWILDPIYMYMYFDYVMIVPERTMAGLAARIWRMHDASDNTPNVVF
eukprot:SAG11_NODE_30558_length_299_cov_5.265000_1_plen_54_part_10